MKKITITADGSLICLFCQFSEKELAKSVPGYYWNNAQRCWEYPKSLETATRLIAAFAGYEIDADEQVQTLLYGSTPVVYEPPADISVRVDRMNIRVTSKYAYKDLVVSAGSCFWDKNTKEWVFAKSSSTAIDMVDTYGNRGLVVKCDDEFIALYNSAKLIAEADELRNDGENLPNIPNFSREAWPHQRAAYWFIYRLWGGAVE